MPTSIVSKRRPTSGKKPHQTSPTPIKRPELNEFQKFLADLLADMIIRGGADEDMRDLLNAATSHHWRLNFGNKGLTLSNAERSEDLNKFVAQETEEWRNKLNLTWPPQKDRPDMPEPKNISERIRQDTRGALREHFETFMARCTPEEMHLLNEVFVDYESTSSPSGGETDERDILVADSLMRVLGRGEYYIHVPEKHWTRVYDFLDALEGKCAK